MRHSGWWPDEVLRLFRRDRGRFSDDRVHERVIVEGDIGVLREIMLHESFRSLDQVLSKISHYSREGAQAMHERGRTATLRTAVGHGVWTFVRTYFLQRGFMDGREGFVLAVSNAEGAYYRYLRLMYMGAAKEHS
jgi:hypothetical protein